MEYLAAAQRIRKPILLCLFLSVFAFPCECYTILLLPLPIKSHIFSMAVIGEEFAKRGHGVHMFVETSFHLSSELTANQSGITVIRYGSQDQGKPMDYDKYIDEMSRSAMEGNFPVTKVLSEMREFTRRESHHLFIENDQVFEEMSKAHYDLAVVDSILFGKFLYLIPLRLGIPWITYTDILNPSLVKVPWLPSFYAPKLVSSFRKMTFIEKLKNIVVSLLVFYYPLIPDPPEEVLSIYRKYGAFSSMDDLISRSLLFVITSDIVLDEPLPFMPNMINAGGLTVKPAKSKSLPKDFEAFIGAAKSGAVVVSFGSNALSLPTSVTQKLVDAFSRLPDLHFIWRFKNTDNLTLPKNVMAANWLPQNDLLADSRVQLFITHAGNNGQFESVYHGVPMIGFPLLGDQMYNAKRLEYKGYGFVMRIQDFTSDQLLENIRKILSDPSYKKRVSLASEIFRSAPRSPAERVADGVEHVLRFGADHLRSAGNDLPFYQYLMLDVVAFITLVLVAAFVLIWKAIRFFIRGTLNAFSRRPKSKSD